MIQHEKVKLLYIDDEHHNLISFKAMFRHDYEVLIANSADEGLQALADHPNIHVIFCDQRMPEKTGVQFFQEISERYPDPVRILITGFIDMESVIKAINEGHVYRYLTKPWREEDVRSAIEEGYKYYTTSSMLAMKIKELQETNAELDKFTYSVTHDIRGPVVSMLSALQLINGMDDISEIKELVGMMERSAEKVKELINNIHSYHHLKRGSLNIQEIQFHELLKGLIPLHQVDANINKVLITTHIVQEDAFSSDLTLLQLVFNNLLTNAIKYHRKEEMDRVVNVDIQVAEGAANIVVEDNGIGIDPLYTEKIFDMFFRATKQNIGSGFGLYNVKDALKKLNGTILVESIVEKGTKFIINIPAK